MSVHIYRCKKLTTYIDTNLKSLISLNRLKDSWIIAKVLVPCFLYQMTAYMIVGTLYEIMVNENVSEQQNTCWMCWK